MQKYNPTFFTAERSGEQWAGMREDSERGEYYAVEEVDARIAEPEKALRLIAAHKGKALLGDGRYDEGAKAAFNLMADIAASVL